MKYCLPYIRNFKYMEDLDEVYIPYNCEDDVVFLESMLKLRREFQNTIVIEITDENKFIEKKCIEYFKQLQRDELIGDFKLKFPTYSQDYNYFYRACKNAEIPFFFGKHIKDWDSFHYFIDLGVSDLYIVESLAFELDKLGALAHAKGISIRAFANVCQSSVRDFNILKSFFIRPEDVHIYEPYVDVIEFYGDLTIQEVMYKVYARDGKWFGPLQEIIIGLDSAVILDSRFIVPVYARTRLKCGKRCLKGFNCSICEKVVDVGETLKERGTYIKQL